MYGYRKLGAKKKNGGTYRRMMSISESLCDWPAFLSPKPRCDIASRKCLEQLLCDCNLKGSMHRFYGNDRKTPTPVGSQCDSMAFLSP